MKLRLRLAGTLMLMMLVLAMVVPAVSAAPVPDEWDLVEDARVEAYYQLPGPDSYVRLVTAEGERISAIVDDVCLRMLFVSRDAYNSPQAFYLLENIGGGPDGSDQRYVGTLPRLVADRIP